MTDNNTARVELLPCPLCNSTAEMRKGYSGKTGYHWPSIVCHNGHGFRVYVEGSPMEDAEANLITAWNTRTPSTLSKATGEDAAFLARLYALARSQGDHDPRYPAQDRDYWKAADRIATLTVERDALLQHKG
jgi:hypothetical protein